MKLWKVAKVAAMTLAALCGVADACWSQSEPDVLMQKWIDYMTPGAEHELLQQRVGKWEVKIETREAPDAQTMLGTGTAEVVSMMDGRYFLNKTEGRFGDQPFTGQGIYGYDRLKGKFVAIWFDNLGTGFSVGTGSYDEQAKAFDYWTMSPDIKLGRYKGLRTVEHHLGPDQWSVEIFDTTDEGREFLMMKAVYQRVKTD